MKDQYKISQPTAKIDIEVEKEVIETLKLMEGHTKLSVSEIANTALKRYISSHKDFLPPTEQRRASKNV